MPPILESDACELCGTCYDVCPQNVFAFEKDIPVIVAYPEECWHCGACVLDCPSQAIRLKLPLPMHIVPSPALFASPELRESSALKKAAAFSRSVIEEG